ncbi:MAG: SDR family oxidoreductase, partial [Actinobacteria bacterium]|nr:SDR family oxidoreductase [Actinomycetota bacterium]
MTIVWNAQRVSEGLAEIDSARGVVLANIKKLLDEYHGVEKSTRFYDILLGDWVERYLHLVYVASQQYAIGEQNSEFRPKSIAIKPTRDTAEFFEAHQVLPDLMLATLQVVSFLGTDSVRVVDDEVTITNSAVRGWRDAIGAVVLKLASLGTKPKIVFVKPFSGRTPRAWVSALISWRRWARQDDFNFSISLRSKIDAKWRHKNLGSVSTDTKLGEIANALVDKNFNVYTNSRNRFKTLEMSGLKSSAHFSFDATSRKDVIIGLRSMAKQGIVLDSLVCSVGDGSIRLDERSENWASNFDVNFLSSINVLEESLDIWPETLRNIVLISSIAGIKPMQSPPIEYSVAKAALNYYVKVKSLELAAKNVSLNAVVPGNILFPNSVWEKKMRTNPKDTTKYIDNNVPL